RLMLSTPLMKGERDEFAALVREAVEYVNTDKGIRRIYPLALGYVPGEEKKLLEELLELADILKDETMSEVEELARSMAAKKEAALAKGQEHLDNKDYDEARSVFNAISGEFPEDGKLRGDIGEKFLNAAQYEDAARYYSEAVHLDPKALNNYNRLAIALRKLGRYDIAEAYYMRALPLAPEDPNLLFNIGRLYLEWEKWGKAVEYGEKAHALHPGFAEAQKLANFARKRMAS
ncbi:MAG: tetratricopeptide repeat protein, partial [Deltaproteobacteria bacterium]|nr:tetratricopeptide repeat protein [Deltaproteobacteria bacterium]